MTRADNGSDRRREYQRKYREEHPQRLRELKREYYYRTKGETAPKTRTCTSCGRELPIEMFRDKAGRLSHSFRCCECRATNRRKPRVGNGQGKRHEYHAKRYAEHKQEIKAKQVLGTVVTEDTKPKKEEAPSITCKMCEAYPCFFGIDNLESNFALTCRSFNKKQSN